jgi:hypothetical protein
MLIITIPDYMITVKYVPTWFPGADFKTTAKQWRSNLESSVEDPAAFVEHQMANGKDNASFLSQLMQNKSFTDEEASENKWLAASLYAAGADTVC